MLGNLRLLIVLQKKHVRKRAINRGVTKGKQWIRLNKNVELLDTPGILWPKFEDQKTGLRLAYIGSIKDELFNIYELSLLLLEYLHGYYPGAVSSFIKLNRKRIVQSS